MIKKNPWILLLGLFLGVIGFFVATADDKGRYLASVLPMVIPVSYIIIRSDKN